MTTQASMTNLVLERPEPSADTATASAASQNRSSAQPSLPYCASHQAEFLYLQAETEALLRRLETVQQQRAAHQQPINSINHKR